MNIDTGAMVGHELLRIAGDDYPIIDVIKIAVSKISRIWVPSYALFPDRSEQERTQSAFDTYGVMPK